VIVWIHGGAFQVGAGDIFQAKYFLDEDVVLVTFNYRLGALGKCLVNILKGFSMSPSKLIEWQSD